MILSAIDRKGLQGFILLALLSSYFLLFSQYGFNLWDEGALLNGGLRVLDGELPIRDFNGYPPGRYFLSATIFALFGEAVLPLRAAISVLTALSVIILYLSARQIMPRPFALISSALYMVAPSVYYNRFFPIFLIIGLFFIFKMVDGRGWRSYASLLLGVFTALLFKFEVAVILYFSGVVILILRRGARRVLPLLTALLPLALVLLYAGPGFFMDFYKLLFQTFTEWGTPFPVPQFEIPLKHMVSGRGLFDALLFYYPPLIYLVSTALLLTLLFRKKCGGAFELKLLALLLVGTLAFGLVIWRSGFDNLVRVLPPAMILTGLLLSLSYKGYWSQSTRRGPFAEPLLSQFPRGLLSIISLPFFAMFSSWYVYQMVWNHGFYVGSIGAIREGKSLLPLERARLFTNEVESEWAFEITEYIRESSDEEELLLALPLNPGWNFLADRKNPLPFEWIIPSTMRKAGVEEEVVEVLKRFPPKLIVLSDIAIDNRESRRFSNYARNIFVYITENYSVVRQVGLFTLFKRSGVVGGGSIRN